MSAGAAVTSGAGSSAALAAPQHPPLEVTRVQLFEVCLPLRHSFETSSHRKSSLTHILVRLSARAADEAATAGGPAACPGAPGPELTGWGEIASPAAPFFCADTTATSWHVAERYLAPALLGRRFSSPLEAEASWAKIRGHEFAKSGFSIALWDLASQAAGVSLASYLGGTAQSVTAGVSLGIEPSIDALLGQVQKQVDAGYPRVKLKIAPGWDEAPVREVLRAFPGVLVHVDANGAYEPGDEATRLFCSLDGLGLTMLEQPFAPRDFVAHSELQARLATPICLDESIVSVHDLHTMLRLDAGRVLNIKVSRMGGLGVARQAHAVARAAGVPVWCGGMHEFGVGRAANVAISSLPGFTLPSDVSGSDKYYEHDIIDPPVTAARGQVRVPAAPGLGHRVQESRVRELALRSWDSAADPQQEPQASTGQAAASAQSTDSKAQTHEGGYNS